MQLLPVGLRAGVVVDACKTHGWIWQNNGQRVFLRQGRTRAVVLDEFGQPMVGTRDSRYYQPPVKDGERVYFLPGSDSRGRRRAHFQVRISEWTNLTRSNQASGGDK